MRDSKGPRPKKQQAGFKHINLFSFYCDNRVGCPEEMPTGPHWAALLFGTRSVYQPGYDDRDPGHTSQEDDHQYYVFNDEAELSQFILFCQEEKKKFVFFKVAGIGKAETKVSVTVAIT